MLAKSTAKVNESIVGVAASDQERKENPKRSTSYPIMVKTPCFFEIYSAKPPFPTNPTNRRFKSVVIVTIDISKPAKKSRYFRWPLFPHSDLGLQLHVEALINRLISLTQPPRS
jgi:hypothetical protein